MSLVMKIQIKNHGSIKIALWEDKAPLAVESVIATANKGLYNNKRIERFEPGFVIQPLFFDGVNPEIDKMIKPEFMTREDNHLLKFKRGIVAMAGDEKSASGTQFFISLSATERLNGKFTVIGEVIDGWDEIERLEKLAVNEFVDEMSGFIYHAPKYDETVERVEVEDNVKFRDN